MTTTSNNSRTDITPQHIYNLIDQDYRQWQCPRSFSDLETLWYLHHRQHIDATLLNSLLSECEDKGLVINAQLEDGKLVHLPASARMVDLRLRCWWTGTGRKIVCIAGGQQ